MAPIKHGESGKFVDGHWKEQTPEYRAWFAMRSRCRSHPRYAGLGISVCHRWNVYEHFLADMGRRPSEEYSLDRVDNTGDYEPSNCRWATITQQNRNRSCTSITEQMVREIRGRIEHGEPVASIASRLQVSKGQVKRILTGVRWSGVE
jgi:hypothetical protein